MIAFAFVIISALKLGKTFVALCLEMHSDYNSKTNGGKNSFLFLETALVQINIPKKLKSNMSSS